MKAMRALDKSDPTHNVMLSGWLIFLAMLFDVAGWACRAAIELDERLRRSWTAYRTW